MNGQRQLLAIRRHTIDVIVINACIRFASIPNTVNHSGLGPTSQGDASTLYDIHLAQHALDKHSHYYDD